MRGRGGSNNNGNNQNRKGPNPLTRSYESNGPDVKIRGSAQQIAEKYTTLARDAQSAGDRVMAENYLQHAEHYNRIIMAAMAQMPQPPVRDMRDDEDGDEDGDDNGLNNQQQTVSADQGEQNQQRQRRQPRDGSGPQPVIEGTPAEVALTEASEVEAPPAPRSEGRRTRSVAARTTESEATKDEGEQQVAQAAPEGEAEGADEGEVPARRPRRTRRPRLKSSEEGGEDAPQPSDDPVTEAAQ